MENPVDFALKEKYAKVEQLRSRLEDIKKLINWDQFLSLFADNASQF